MGLSARENLTLPNLKPFWRRFGLRRAMESQEALSWFNRLSVRPAAVEKQLSTFSGGNQQKILFAKWLRLKPLVFLLDEPTHGVDVGAKTELHQRLISAASDGATIIVSSSEADELAVLARRVLIFRDGRIVSELVGSDVTAGNISRLALGADDLKV